MDTRPKPLALTLLLLLLLLFLGGCQPAVVAPTETVPATVAPAAVPSATPVPASPTPVPPPAQETATAESPGEPVAAATVETQVAGVSLAYPADLAQEIAVEVLPATKLAPDEWQMRLMAHPAMTTLQLVGYPLNDELRQAHISFIPVEAASALQLRAEQRVERLQRLLADRPEPPLPAGELPFLPIYNAAQMLHAREAYLSFAGGSGLRYLTVYAQDYVPIANQLLQYTFQGLTADGRFYVSASFPVHGAPLPADIPAAQESGWDGTTYYRDTGAYQEYVAAQRALLAGFSPGDFTPSLAELDGLIQSLDLSAYGGPDIEPWAAEVLPGPDQVLDDFFERYTTAGGFWAGAYEDDPALHPAFAAELAEMRAAWQAQGANLAQYDPLVMSANLGAFDDFSYVMLDVGPALVDGEQAEVRVERRAHPGSTVLPLRYSLVWSEEAGSWQITGVTAILSHPQREITAAERVVEDVYGPGLAARPGVEGVGIEKLDLPTEVGATLCAQDCPWGFVVEGAFPTGEAGENGEPVIDVVAYTSFRHDAHIIRVEPRAAGYVITAAGSTRSATDLARAFYTWYLSEATVFGQTRWTPRQPEIGRMNDYHYFVTERFLREASRRMVDEDPYLPLAEVPASFRVEAGPQENIVLVHLNYPDGEQTLQLTLVEEGTRLFVDNIELFNG